MKIVRIGLLSLCTLFCAASAVKAQQQGNTTPPPTQQINWGDELKQAKEENAALRNILAAVESIDTARQSELVQWIVTDRSIRSRVISALRKAGRNISPSTSSELIITQKPATMGTEGVNTDVDLLRIVIESAGIYGAPTIKKILGEDLYNKINKREGYEHTLITTESAQTRIQYARITAALWGGSIIFKSGFGFGAELGSDRLGYPFWLPGNVSINGFIHKEFTDARLGLNFQLGEAGITPFNIAGGFRIKERKLEGTGAFNAEIHQALDVLPDPKQSGRLSVGGDVYNSFDPNIRTFSQRAFGKEFRTDYVQTSPTEPKRDSLFYIGFAGHGFVGYSFGESLKGLYVQGGLGTHTIRAATIGETLAKTTVDNHDDVKIVKTYSYFDPLLKIGYAYNNGNGDEWGISMQYSNTMLAEGFVRVLSFLDIHAKYSVVIGRDARKWEWSDFVIISPVLKFNF